MNTQTQNTQNTENTKTTLFDIIYLLSLPVAAILYFINI